MRQSVTLDSSVILVPADRSLNNWLRLIALIYLGIGVYVLLRRWTAPGSTHFYIFCLVSFIAYSFKYTRQVERFRLAIYWSNVVAWVLQPALFLHFVLTFPGEAGVRAAASVAAGPGLCAGCRASGEARHCVAAGTGQRIAALGHGPAGHGLRRVAVRRCGRRAVVTATAWPARPSCGSN